MSVFRAIPWGICPPPLNPAVAYGLATMACGRSAGATGAAVVAVPVHSVRQAGPVVVAGRLLACREPPAVRVGCLGCRAPAQCVAAIEKEEVSFG